MYKSNKKYISLLFSLILGLISLPAASSVVPEALPLDVSKCYFVKGYKKGIANSKFSRALKRLAQLESLVSSLSLLESPNGVVCDVDNDNYSKVREELDVLDKGVYKAIRGNIGTISKTKKRKTFIKDQRAVINAQIAVCDERIEDLSGLKSAIENNESFTEIITGVDNSDLDEVVASLWVAERYKSELENRLTLWDDLAKRFRVDKKEKKKNE